MKIGYIILIISSISILIYVNSLENDFLFDDEALTSGQEVVSGDLGRLIKTYRPLRYISYSIDYHLIGKKPWAFRISNIFYHMFTTLSIFWLFMLLGMKSRSAFIGAFIFAVHPIHSDAVAYVSGRRDVLTALFYVLSINFFILFYRAMDTGGKKSLIFNKFGLFFMSVLMMLFSFFSKEMGVTIPLVWLLYIYYKNGNAIFKTRWFYSLTVILVMVFSILGIYAVQSGGSAFATLETMRFHGNSMKTHYFTALTLPVYYIKQTVFPLQLIMDNINYPLVKEMGLKLMFSIFGILAYLAIVFSLLMKRDEKGRLYKLTAFFMLFFILTLAPVLQIIPLHEIVAEHYLYLPSLAFCGIVGIVVDSSWERYKRWGFLRERSSTLRFSVPMVLILFVAVSIFYVRRTLDRNRELKNWTTVLSSDKRWRPLSYRSLYTIGKVYGDMKFPDKELEYINKSIKAGFYDEGTYTNLIGYYLKKGDLQKAEEIYEKMPGQLKIFGILRVNLAYMFLLTGECEKALSLVPDMEKKYAADIKAVQSCSSYKDKDNLIYSRDVFDECMAEIDDTGYCMAKSLAEKKEYLHALMYINDSERKNSDVLEVIKLKADILLKVDKLKITAKPYLKQLIKIEDDLDEKIEYIDKLAFINLISDIPEALKYYRMEKDLLEKSGRNIPVLLEKTIAVLAQYIDDVLVKGKHYKLDL